MARQRKKGSIIKQVTILFAVCILLTGGITFVSQLNKSGQSVTEAMETHAEEIASEVQRSVKEYPAHEWLLKYWYEHAEDLDIEYDADFGVGTETEEKCRLLASHCPELQLNYADESTLQSLSERDQKLYAEIIYSWLITRLDQIKESYHINYLYCVQVDEAYETQFFLFGAADSGEARGTEADEIYPLGMIKEIAKAQRNSMLAAKEQSTYFTEVDGYVDYYSCLGESDGQQLFIGITFSIDDLLNAVKIETGKGSVAAMGYQIILALLSLIGILILVLKPLKKIQASIRSYKDTKDSACVAAELRSIVMDNEIGELSEDVVDLAREVDDYIEMIQKITAEKERIDTELVLAEQIQRDMLPQEFPPFPDRQEFDIYASMDPAREVGGDFYDFFLIDDDHLCLVIADVSGKGIPAALFMMVSHSFIRNCALIGKSVSEVLETTNDALIPNNKSEMFVTIWIGILEISTGKLTAANAGHEYPMIRRGESQKLAGPAFGLYKDKHGFVIGGMEGLKYQEYELQLEPGSTIFVYTDGLPEATDENNNLFGTERVLDALNSEPDADPEKILTNVTEHVNAFVKDAEQFDDLTMLCMHYNGPAGNGPDPERQETEAKKAGEERYG